MKTWGNTSDFQQVFHWVSNSSTWPEWGALVGLWRHKLLMSLRTIVTGRFAVILVLIASKQFLWILESSAYQWQCKRRKSLLLILRYIWITLQPFKFSQWQRLILCQMRFYFTYFQLKEIFQKIPQWKGPHLREVWNDIS